MITVSMPDKSRFSTTAAALLSGFHVVVAPEEGDCREAAAYDQVAPWTEKSLKYTIRQGCSYAIGVEIGKIAAGGAALQEVYFSNVTESDKKGEPLAKEDFLGKKAVRFTAHLKITANGRKQGFSPAGGEVTTTPGGATDDKGETDIEIVVDIDGLGGAAKGSGSSDSLKDDGLIPDIASDKRPLQFSGSKNQQAQAFLKVYAPDGAFIISEYERLGGRPNYGSWLDGSFFETDTLVHESCHGLDNLKAGQRWGVSAFYISGGEHDTLVMENRKVFNSNEIAALIPEGLRTMRFDPYLYPGGGNMASQVDGIYGLMEEYNCYFNGAYSTFATYSYYGRTGNIAAFQQEMQVFAAYYEFRYFILKYLLFAKERHPDVYEGLMAHAELRQAYDKITTRYKKVVDSYLRLIRENSSFKKDPLGMDDYNMLKDELEKSVYKDLEAKLK
jgi:hypothetical protein